MKVRSGFVSNSSSSSFCIYGTTVTDRDALNELYKKLCPPTTGDGEEEDDIECYDQCELISEKIGVGFVCDSESDYFYFGDEYSYQPDEQTFGQFRKNIEESIKTNFGEEYKCSHQEGEICC